MQIHPFLERSHWPVSIALFTNTRGCEREQHHANMR